MITHTCSGLNPNVLPIPHAVNLVIIFTDAGGGTDSQSDAR
jgi:hypothetical protein